MFTEFFCGIGGLACCLSSSEAGTSIDINQNALVIHALNHPSELRLCKTIESLSSEDLSDVPSRLWWMSPPCQPFTRRGEGRDLSDPRSKGFVNMLRLIEQRRPENIGFENVPEFADSASYGRLKEVLKQAEYDSVEITLCPTGIGYQNRRRRFYLAASRTGQLLKAPASEHPSKRQPSLEFDVEFGAFQIPESWLERYQDAIHIIDQQDFLEASALTNCFTSAYGRSPVRSGSYLRTSQGVRLFTPMEILWQLGFPETFQLPDWSPEKLWPLTGNTLALPAVKFLLSHLALPGLIPCP